MLTKKQKNNQIPQIYFVCLYELSMNSILLIFVCCCSATQLCPILCDIMDCTPPGSSVHGIIMARILKWVAISFSRGIFPGSNPRLLHWQADSLPLHHQGSPILLIRYSLLLSLLYCLIHVLQTFSFSTL